MEGITQVISSSPSPVSLREPDQSSISTCWASLPPQLPFWGMVHPASNLQGKTDENRTILLNLIHHFTKEHLPSLAQAMLQLIQWIF